MQIQNLKEPESIGGQASLIYDNEIDKWIQWMLNYQAHLPIQANSMKMYYQRQFLINIQSRMKIKIVMDNLIADCLIQKFDHFQYQRFRKNDYGDKQFMLDLECQSVQEKWIFLIKIANTLFDNKFITKSKLNIIHDLCSKQNSLENRFEIYAQMMQKNRISSGKKDYSIKIRQFNEKVGLNCKDFWQCLIFIKPLCMKNSKIVHKIWSIFEKYLSEKIDKALIYKLVNLLGIEKPSRKQNKDFLNRTADTICLFSYERKISQIKLQLKQFQNRLSKQLSSSIPYLTNDDVGTNGQSVYYETYGSFRSKMCLLNSDVDLAIFIKNQHNQFSQERQFINSTLWKVYGILNKFCKLGDQELQIESVSPLINQKIKVPVVRVKFDNCNTLNNMDIVINNNHGVNNSRLLGVFADNRLIRNLGLLVKKWAKKNKLIGIQELSSYGIILMLLYFMMAEGLLEFLDRRTLYEFNPDIKIKKDWSTFKILSKFFQFYSDDKRLCSKVSVVCLIKGCHDHSQIINPNFLINIHDPFNDTNPGRMKVAKFSLFLQSFERAKWKMESLKSGEGNEEELNKMFGLEYEEID